LFGLPLTGLEVDRCQLQHRPTSPHRGRCTVVSPRTT